MYISVVTVFVNDLERATDFYTKQLGWEKTMDEEMGDDSRWVTVAPKGSQTAFSLAAWEPDRVGSSTGVVIEVDDVFKTHEEWSKKGIEFSEKPVTQPWGGWAQFKDSEGNIFGLHSPAHANVSRN